MFQPYGNSTTLPPAGWHPEPNVRGTFSILSTCMLTMFLCIWTAVHLNVPEHKKEHVQTLRRTGWLILGLLAPELVAWNAWEQRREVKWLTRRLREQHRRRFYMPQRAPSNKPLTFRLQRITKQFIRKVARFWHRILVVLLLEPGELDDFDTDKWELNEDKDSPEAIWTDIQSWYIVMGGVVFDTSSAEKPFLPDGAQRITLTPKGFLALSEYWPDLVPLLTTQDILDKSKSDSLAKCLTCWQASWFIAQCIFRLAQGLSISLLEVNVFGHATCAIITYMVWWSKPKDIYQPTKLETPSQNSVAAVLYTLSQIGSVTNKGRRDTIKTKCYWVPAPVVEGCPSMPERASDAQYAYHTVGRPQALKVKDQYWCLMPKDSVGLAVNAPIIVDRLTTSRLDAIQHRSEMQRLVDRSCYKVGDNDYFFRPGNLVKKRQRNWSISQSIFDNTKALFWYLNGMILACGFYGGLHVTAWNVRYRSAATQILWRASSLSVTVSGCVLMIVFGFICACRKIKYIIIPRTQYDESGLKQRVWQFIEGLLIWPAVVMLGAAGLWYLFCRSFLVVESFLNVAYLSDAVLQVPNWPSYIPHIS